MENSTIKKVKCVNYFITALTDNKFERYVRHIIKHKKYGINI